PDHRHRQDPPGRAARAGRDDHGGAGFRRAGARRSGPAATRPLRRVIVTLTWTKENSPRWDADKQRIFGPAELAATGLPPPRPGEPVADEWWRVADGGEVAGYGWLD